jgi:hypothetical protein
VNLGVRREVGRKTVRCGRRISCFPDGPSAWLHSRARPASPTVTPSTDSPDACVTLCESVRLHPSPLLSRFTTDALTLKFPPQEKTGRPLASSSAATTTRLLARYSQQMTSSQEGRNAPGARELLAVGARVRCEGLTGAAELNGCLGRVMSHHEGERAGAYTRPLLSST